MDDHHHDPEDDQAPLPGLEEQLLDSDWLIEDAACAELERLQLARAQKRKRDD